MTFDLWFFSRGLAESKTSSIIINSTGRWRRAASAYESLRITLELWRHNVVRVGQLVERVSVPRRSERLVVALCGVHLVQQDERRRVQLGQVAVDVESQSQRKHDESSRARTGGAPWQLS